MKAPALLLACAAALAWGPCARADTPAGDTQATIVFPSGSYTGSVRPEVTQHAPIPVSDKAKVTFADGKSRHGSTVIPDGHGTFTDGSGWTLEANFVDGVPDCTGTPPDCAGTITGPNGFVVHGTFAKGELTGGTVDYGNGERYEGGLEGDCFSGDGTYTSKDGTQAKGTWEPVAPAAGGACTGSRFTHGVVSGPQGTFTGSFAADGRPDGPGRYDDPYGRTFSGTWRDGDYDGQVDISNSKTGRLLARVDVDPPGPKVTGAGTAFTPAGSRVTGHFVEGVLSGPARLVESNGRTHDGSVTEQQFASRDGYVENLLGRDGRFAGFRGPVDAAGRANGRGTLAFASQDGRRFELSGLWSHGRIAGPMSARLLTPCCTTFRLVNARLVPEGTFGTRYALEGRATRVTFPSGDTAAGAVVHGALNGPGAYRYASNGCVVRGTFRNGVLAGRATEWCGSDAVTGRIAPDGTVQPD